SPTAQVLIFHSYLEDRIRGILALQMKHLESKKAQERLFDGPLDTFSSRILIAYHLGWLSETQYRRMEAFRNLRNEFAHNPFKVSLTDNNIRSFLATIDYGSTGIYERISANPINSYFVPNLLSNLITLTMFTFHDLLLLPIAIANYVDHNDIINPREDQPALM